MALRRVTQPVSKEISTAEKPKLRLGLQPFLYKADNQEMYVGLKDPLALSDAFLLVPQDLSFLLQFFDGQHSTADLTSAYMRRFNNFLPAERLADLINKLDGSLLLENKRSQKKLEHIAALYRRQEFRAPVCIGNSYAAEAQAAKNELTEYGRRAAVDQRILEKLRNRQIRGMILPHIDPRLGGPAYAAAYNVLASAKPVELFIILGISHQPMHNIFALTAKDFQTPLGLVQTDQDFVNQLAGKCATNFFHDELAHRNEHSVEFQTLFMQFQQSRPFKIVPILCSFSHNNVAAETAQFDEFIAALKAAIQQYAGTVCLIASVDFSHVGPYYGDSVPPDAFFLAQVEQSDKAVLDALARQNCADFQQCFIRSNNKYSICGYPAMRTFIELLPPTESVLLKYDNAIMDEQRSTVTFASMLFY